VQHGAGRLGDTDDSAARGPARWRSLLSGTVASRPASPRAHPAPANC